MFSPPLAGPYYLNPLQSQLDMVQGLIDNGLLAQMPALTRRRSEAWIEANVLPAHEITIDFPQPGEVSLEEDSRPTLTLATDGSGDTAYDGPEDLSLLVRAYQLATGIVFTFHGLMDRMSELRQPIGSPDVIMHNRFTGARFAQPLRFDLFYTQAPPPPPPP